MGNMPEMLETMGATPEIFGIIAPMHDKVDESKAKNPAQVHVYNDGIVVCSRYDGDMRGKEQGVRTIVIKGTPTYVDKSICREEGVNIATLENDYAGPVTADGEYPNGEITKVPID